MLPRIALRPDEPLGEVALDLVEAHSFLLHFVAVTDRHGPVVESLEVDGDAERRAHLILTAVAVAIMTATVGCGSPDTSTADAPSTSAAASPTSDPAGVAGSDAIVDTGQDDTYGTVSAIAAPAEGEPLLGQDAQHAGNQPSYAANGDGTVTDAATSLMWAQDYSGVGMNLEEALVWADEANAAAYLGYTDWRVPNSKELQSLLDYSRSPSTSGSAAIDSVFNATSNANEAGQPDYATYVAFGRAMGYMNGQWVYIHGAGAQRSDPKEADAADCPEGDDPQGDAIRIDNMVRLVRDV